MIRVDLNSDLGESFGGYRLGTDEDVLSLVSSANVACGWHGGDPAVMERTVAAAANRGAAVGAHPGYPDLMGFGRRNMAISPDDARVYVKYQIGALLAFTKTAGVPLQHVKLHGAFYNQAAADEKLAAAVCQGIREVDDGLIVLALAGSAMVRIAAELGLRAACEVFADRAYMEDGSLVPRGRPDAMIHDRDQAVRRVVRMVKEGTVESVDGKTISIRADSICVHGDNPEAVGFAHSIRETLVAEGVEIANLATLLG